MKYIFLLCVISGLMSAYYFILGLIVKFGNYIYLKYFDEDLKKNEEEKEDGNFNSFWE